MGPTGDLPRAPPDLSWGRYISGNGWHHPGLAFFYGGFVQARNVLNTMAMSFVMMGIATLVWVSFGFSLAFSDGGVFEELEKTPYSNPPELPDVMKPGQEASTQETTTA